MPYPWDNHPIALCSVLALALFALGCRQIPTQNSAAPIAQPWQKSTRIESAYYEPDVPVFLWISTGWKFNRPNDNSSLCIQGEVAHTIRSNRVETTRGVYIQVIAPVLKDGGEGYIDQEEVPALLAAMDRFLGNERLFESGGDALVGMSFLTKGMVFFRAGMDSASIGTRKMGSATEEVAVGSLTKSDVAEIKMKIDLARQWAEKQAPQK